MDSMKARIEQLYGERVLRRSALRLNGGEETLRRVLDGAGVRTALEIGTYRGCTAAALAQWCGRVVTIDLVRGQFDKENEANGFDRQEFWQSLGIRNVVMHLVKDDAEKEDLVQGLDFDFAFVDGGHDDLSVARDFALTRRCGRVLFHDYVAPPHRMNGVTRLVSGLPKDQVRLMGEFALWTA